MVASRFLSTVSVATFFICSLAQSQVPTGQPAVIPVPVGGGAPIEAPDIAPPARPAVKAATDNVKLDLKRDDRHPKISLLAHLAGHLILQVRRVQAGMNLLENSLIYVDEKDGNPGFESLLKVPDPEKGGFKRRSVEPEMQTIYALDGETDWLYALSLAASHYAANNPNVPDWPELRDQQPFQEIMGKLAILKQTQRKCFTTLEAYFQLIESTLRKTPAAPAETIRRNIGYLYPNSAMKHVSQLVDDLTAVYLKDEANHKYLYKYNEWDTYFGFTMAESAAK